jgi:tubulin-specific chaperone D
MSIITDLCHKIIDERFLRSFGGDQMRLALSKFIENCSTGHLPLPPSIIEPWLAVLRDCLASADVSVQQAAVKPVAALINQYFSESPSDVQTAILERFIVDMASSNQQARMGNSLALGSMPKFMLAGNLSRVINNLCQVAEITESTLQWAESRKNALSALAQITVTVGIADPGISFGIFCVLLQ